MHRIVKLVAIIGIIGAIVGIAMMGISTAQDATPTPTPTPIPQTPAMFACQQFDWAIMDAEINLFVLPAADPDKASGEFMTMQNRIEQRLEYIAGVTKEAEPLMYRLIAPTRLHVAIAHHSGNFNKMIAGLRQLHRVCETKGYGFQSPSDTMSSDTILEVVCGNSGLIADTKRSAFFDGFWSCQDNHNHNLEYAGRYHTHGPYGNVIGGY